MIAVFRDKKSETRANTLRFTWYPDMSLYVWASHVHSLISFE